MSVTVSTGYRNTGAGAAHVFTRAGSEIPVAIEEIIRGTVRGHLLAFGEIADGCFVRIHSRCFYGESLGSDDCDCQAELDKSMNIIQKHGGGVLIYLEQEGRGMGLLAKARGHAHSELYGTDTFTSYEALGYPADGRSYREAVEALRDLGLTAVQLLTNNPEKAAAVRDGGIQVTVVPLRVRPRTARAAAYLDAKRRRRRHWIPTDDAPWAPDPN
ncbi:GTP cyclohydrolase [Nocardia sp. NPDC004068]|uniref:GTP cyclohydrolase n=1 Tax=Nocardia sp. NPDC004068 TaxID=3364303 RepID=UPI00368D19C2